MFKFSLILLAQGLFFNCGLLAAELAPPDFKINQNQYVFVDFQSASYEIVFDLDKREVSVVSTIEFVQNKDGQPVFDIVDQPNLVQIDGQTADVPEVSLPTDDGSVVRGISKSLSVGLHNLVIKHSITNSGYIKWKDGYVDAGFFLGGNAYRWHLERYLPSNLPYDQFQISYKVKFVGGSAEQIIFANGKITRLNNAGTKYLIEYPSHFNSSAPYFHTTKQTEARIHKRIHKSQNGKAIPIMVYYTDEYDYYEDTVSNRLSSILERVERLLVQLEELFGPWPHEQLLIYLTRQHGAWSGVEYSGATATSFTQVNHEVIHSYIGRGWMPANGDTLWMDEAMTRWVENGLTWGSISPPAIANPPSEKNKLSGFSPYLRYLATPHAYDYGALVMGHISYQYGEDFFKFFASWVQKNQHKVVSEGQFINDLEDASGQSFKHIFDSWVYGL